MARNRWAFIPVGAGCQGLNLSMIHAFGLFLKLMSSAYDQVRGIILAVSYRVGIAMLWLRAGESFSGRVFVVSSHASPELQGISVGEPLKGSDLSGDNTDPDFIDKLPKKGQHKIGYRPKYTRSRKPLHGFTLIELLVVIAIIALLLGVLIPALSAAREQCRRAVCGLNEKNTGLGLFVYANDHDGKLPLNEVDRWLFDVSYWTTDIILRTGAFDRHIFYCPSWRRRDKIIFWRYGENLPAGTPENYPQPEPQDEATRKNMHRIMGYFWFIDTVRGRKNPPMSPDNRHKEWVRSVTATQRSGAMVELIADVTASNGPDRSQSDFTKATGGCWSRWRVYDRTNHLRRGTRPAGGNVLFVDGHVQWRRFSEMEHRWFWQRYANPCFWW